jgi:hypothetical protein
VIHVARTHAVVACVIVASVGLLHLLTRNLPGIEFRRSTYVIALGLGALYALTAFLVWRGVPPGRQLSRCCTLLYLPRPSFGLPLLRLTDEPEFRAHFEKPPVAPAADARRPAPDPSAEP